MTLLRIEPRTVSNRAAFWVVFFSIAAVCFMFLLPGQMRQRNAQRAVEKLQPMLAAEARFSGVRVSLSTNAKVVLRGTVHSADELTALRSLVEDARLPCVVGIDIKVSSEQSNDQ